MSVCWDQRQDYDVEEDLDHREQMLQDVIKALTVEFRRQSGSDGDLWLFLDDRRVVFGGAVSIRGLASAAYDAVLAYQIAHEE